MQYPERVIDFAAKEVIKNLFVFRHLGIDYFRTGDNGLWTYIYQVPIHCQALG